MSTTQDLTDALEEVTKLLEGYHKRDLPYGCKDTYKYG